MARPTAEPLVRAGALVRMLLGLGGVLVGAWAAIAPYAGPRIGFHVDGGAAWQWSSTHTALALVPGAVACAAGLVLFVSALRVHGGAERWVLVGCGAAWGLAAAWLAAGPLAWPVLTSNAAPFLGGTARHRLLVQVGSSIAPALVLALLAGLALGLVRRSGQSFESGAMAGPPEEARATWTDPNHLAFESVPAAPPLEVPPWPRPALEPEVAAASLDETGDATEWWSPVHEPEPDAWTPIAVGAPLAMAGDPLGESRIAVVEAEPPSITPPPLVEDLPVWGPPEVRFEPEVWSPSSPPQTSTRNEHPTATYSTRPGMHRPPPGWQRPDLTEPPRSR